jgi:hypothetical protein
VVVLEQPRSDQPVSGRVLRRVAESVAGSLSTRAGERAVQHRGSGDVERLVVVPQAAGGGGRDSATRVPCLLRM